MKHVHRKVNSGPHVEFAMDEIHSHLSPKDVLSYDQTSLYVYYYY